MSRNKTNILFAAMFVMVIAIGTTTTSAAQAVKPTTDSGLSLGSQGQGHGKQLKCNNIKIMAIVTGLDTSKGTIYLTGSTTLQGQTVQKNISFNASATSDDDGVGLPLFFKKAFTPCPAIGTPFSGVVNGVTFSGVLQSLTKPNVIEVDLTGTQELANK